MKFWNFLLGKINCAPFQMLCISRCIRLLSWVWPVQG